MPFVRTAPPQLVLHPGLARYARRIRGMGQCDPTDPTCLAEAGTVDLTNAPSIAPGNILMPPVTPVPISGVASPGSSSAGLPGGALVPVASVPSNSSSAGLAQLITALGGSATTAAQLYNYLQGPSLIPGTNAIYNPATGQYYNPTTGQVVNPSGASTLGLSTANISSLLPYLLIGGLGIGAIAIISSMGHK